MIRTKNTIPESVLKKRKTTEKIAAARLAEAVQRKKVMFSLAEVMISFFVSEAQCDVATVNHLSGLICL
jgi:hypothetical protein